MELTPNSCAVKCDNAIRKTATHVDRAVEGVFQPLEDVQLAHAARRHELLPCLCVGLPGMWEGDQVNDPLLLKPRFFLEPKGEGLWLMGESRWRGLATDSATWSHGGGGHANGALTNN